MDIHTGPRVEFQEVPRHLCNSGPTYPEDIRRRPLRASDFCQTNELVAQVLAMVAEEPAVQLLFDELLGSRGCQLAVVPSSRYAKESEQVSFFVLERATTFQEK